MLKIGELARRAGLTVRALRHYDAIGLLSPSERTGKGYRAYSREDVIRLHRIMALRQSGLSLAVIRGLLDDAGASPEETLGGQIALIEERIERDRSLLERLRLLRERMRSGEAGDVGDWLAILEMMTIYERHFTTEELSALRSRRESSGGSLGRDWREVMARVGAAMERGVLPGTPEAVGLAREWMALVARMTGCDAGLAGKLKSLMETEERARELSGITPDMMRWLYRAGMSGGTGSPPKATALRVAEMRAVHQILDIPPVFQDPMALSILGPEGEANLREHVGFYDFPLLRGIRASTAVRARLAEDAWAEAERRGVRQFVILGAGLDTFALRGPDRHGSRVYEVDLPETQAWKRDLMRRAGLAEPDRLRFVSVDFDRSTLAEALAEAGFDAGRPAFFSWLGVTMYLEEEAVLGTLGYVASLPTGGGIVFDYAVQPGLLTERERKGLDMIRAKTAESGEPWKTFFAPADLAAVLAGLGFGPVEDPGADALNERYLSGRTDGLRKSGVTRLVNARI